MTLEPQEEEVKREEEEAEGGEGEEAKGKEEPRPSEVAQELEVKMMPTADDEGSKTTMTMGTGFNYTEANGSDGHKHAE